MGSFNNFFDDIMINNQSGSYIGIEFLKNIDDFIRNNYQKLTRRHIYDMYFDFFKELKNYRSSSHHFTGLSELIMFRFLFHQLGGNFKPNSIDKSVPEINQQKEFISRTNDKLILWQNLNAKKFLDNKKRRNPDITIIYDGKIIGIISIKVYLTNSIKTIEEEIKTLEDFKKFNPNLKALLLIFYRLRTNETEKLKELIKRKNWLHYIILDSEEKDKRLAPDLEKFLGLDNIRKIASR